MIKLLFIIIYFLYGYICFKSGVDAFGGKEKFLETRGMGNWEYFLMAILIMLFWPILSIKVIIRKIRGLDE